MVKIKITFILIIFILLIFSGCSKENKELSKEESEEIALNYYNEEINQRRINALLKEDFNKIEQHFTDFLIKVTNDFEPVVYNSNKDKNWNVFLRLKYEGKLMEQEQKIIVYSDKSVYTELEFDVVNDCINIISFLEEEEGIKEEKDIMNKACWKIYSIYVTNPLLSRYADELKKKQIPPDSLTDDIFPETLAGYPMISISESPETHEIQYGNFEYGEQGYKILEDGDILISLEYEFFEEDIEDYFIYIDNNKYYDKSELLGYQYIIWYDGKYKFKLINRMKGEYDNILFNAFKELRY